MENDRNDINIQTNPDGSLNMQSNFATDQNAQQNASGNSHQNYAGYSADQPNFATYTNGQPNNAAPNAQGNISQNANGQPPEGKKWPWVVLGIAVALILLIGGCASCSVLTLAFDESSSSHFIHDGHGYDGGHHNGQRSYDDLDDYNGGKYFSDTYSLDELIDMIGVDEGDTSGDKYSSGMYYVGDGIAAGLYFLEGDESSIGTYYVFRAADNQEEAADRYSVDQAVVYIGSYFAEFDEGDLVFFIPPEDTDKMFVAPSGPINVTDPIQSGCYRVGIDIPAGEYVVTVDNKAVQAALSVYMNPEAFVMNNMQFDNSQTLDEYDVYNDGVQRVKVKDGDFLELFATQATPAPSA